jgi:hypothetical protein
MAVSFAIVGLGNQLRQSATRAGKGEVLSDGWARKLNRKLDQEN